MRKVLLISIKPEYSSKIFSGEKKIELRKTKPKIKKDDIVIIYESSPTMALKGSVIVDDVVENEPSHLWNEYKNIAGISKHKYEEYYEDRKLAYGILFSEVTKFETPIRLSKLRKIWNGFVPPQSYRYLSYEDSNKFAWLS